MINAYVNYEITHPLGGTYRQHGEGAHGSILAATDEAHARIARGATNVVGVVVQDCNTGAKVELDLPA